MKQPSSRMCGDVFYRIVLRFAGDPGIIHVNPSFACPTGCPARGAAATPLYERRQIAAFKQISGDARRFSRLDVGRLVSDEKAPLPFDWPMLKQIQLHAWIRFAPVMFGPEGCDASLRMKWAIPPVVDRSAGGGQFLRHPAMKRPNRVLPVASLRDAGLIGDDKYIIAGVVQ